jgi:hypothetical protein
MGTQDWIDTQVVKARFCSNKRQAKMHFLVIYADYGNLNEASR